MATPEDIGILVRSCGVIVGSTRVDRMIDFDDLLRELSEITGLDLNMYSLNVSSVINNGGVSSSCPIKSNRDLRFFFSPNTGLPLVELLVECEMKVPPQASHSEAPRAWDAWTDEHISGYDHNPHYQSGITNEAPRAWNISGYDHNHLYQSGITNEHQSSGGYDHNVIPRGITNEVVEHNSAVVDLPALDTDQSNDDEILSQDTTDSSHEEGSSDDEGPAAGYYHPHDEQLSRVPPHPNLSNVPFFTSDYEEIPTDSIGIPSGTNLYNAEHGVLWKGMFFTDKKQMQSVVKDYSVRHARREYRVVQSTPSIWKIVCKQNTNSGIDHHPTSQHCQWWLRAHLSKKHNCWKISQLGPPHSCLMDTSSNAHRNLCKNLLAIDLESLVHVDPTYNVKLVVEHADKKYNYIISYQKAWQALKRARENVFGTWESSCQYLPKYMGALQKYNPGTIVEWLHSDTSDGVVHTLGYVFWAFKPCIEAFRHCRKVLTVDGTHLYTKYKHKLLIANTIDADQKIISVAFAIVDEESFRSWRWFLHMVATHIVGDQDGICLISDRHKGILKAVDRVPAFCEPRGVHRFCLRHVASNFNSKFKNVKLKDLCYQAGKASTVRYFEQIMKQIKTLNRPAYDYLKAIDASKWTFSHDGGRRYGIMTTNMSETINGVLKGARRLPITAIVSVTFMRAKNAFFKRQQELMNLRQRNQRWPNHVLQQFDAEQRLGMTHQVDLYDHQRQTARVSTYLLGSTRHYTSIVSLRERGCTCGNWMVNGLPCSHALEVCRQYRVDSTLFVPDVYSTDAYSMTYSSGFFAPLPDVEEWDEPLFKLKHNPERRINRRGRDVTSRIHNEMDWAQTRARQQYQSQDRAGPSNQGSVSRR